MEGAKGGKGDSVELSCLGNFPGRDGLDKLDVDQRCPFVTRSPAGSQRQPSAS